MTMTVMRFEDMSRRGYLSLHKQDDGDIVISIHEDSEGTRRGWSAAVEFCSSGGGSQRTLAALAGLMGAMAEDNLDGLTCSRRPDTMRDDEMVRISEWAKGAAAARRQIDDLYRELHEVDNRRAEFFEKLADLLREFRVEIVATDDGADYGQQVPLVKFEFQSPDYSETTVAGLSAKDAGELAKKIRAE